MDLRVRGKTVVVTGGSGGIDVGLMMEFMREGANVISTSRNAAHGTKLATRAARGGLQGRLLAVATDVTDRASVDAIDAEAHKGLRNTPEIPVGRLGRPEDIAKLACFLSSDVAGDITGQRVAVRGSVFQN